MPVPTNFVLAQLAKLPQERGLKYFDHNVFVRCPFHGGGRESTGSLKLNTDLEEGYPVGSWVCFGCNKHGPWEDFARATNLKTGKKYGADDIFNLYQSSIKHHQLLGSDAEELDLRPEIRLSPDWEPDKRWRGISGKLLCKLHAKRFIDKHGERLFLPCLINNQVMGGIKCLLDKKDGKISYVYESGQWIRHTLFPYDYTRRLMRRYNKRIVMIGEGPRDSLNPLQYGMPALSNLGGTTVWTKEKAELLMTLEPELIIIATDPDEIGDQLADKIADAFNLQVAVKRLRFPAYIKGKTEKKDPGNMKKSKIKELIRKLGLEKIR